MAFGDPVMTIEGMGARVGASLPRVRLRTMRRMRAVAHGLEGLFDQTAFSLPNPKVADLQKTLRAIAARTGRSSEDPRRIDGVLDMATVAALFNVVRNLASKTPKVGRFLSAVNSKIGGFGDRFLDAILDPGRANALERISFLEAAIKSVKAFVRDNLDAFNAGALAALAVLNDEAGGDVPFLQRRFGGVPAWGWGAIVGGGALVLIAVSRR